MSEPLGFTEDGDLRVSKSADVEETLVFPASYDLSDYDGEFQIRETEDAETALLTVTMSATANGSRIQFIGRNAQLLLKAADLATLPDNASDANDPWIGVFEWVTTDPTGLTSRMVLGTLIAEKGVVR